MKLIIVLFACAVFMLGCQTTQNVMTSVSAPDWITGEPGIAGSICAVGISGPTFFQEDGKKFAAKHAREELARAVSVNVDSIMIDISSERGNSNEKATVMEASSWATSTVLENSSMVDYWYDSDGVLGQEKVTYALACIQNKFAKKSH